MIENNASRKCKIIYHIWMLKVVIQERTEVDIVIEDCYYRYFCKDYEKRMIVNMRVNNKEATYYHELACKYNIAIVLINSC